MIVLDASAAFEFLGQTAAGRKVEQILQSGQALHAPALLDLEIVHVLRRQLRLGAISESRANQLLASLRDLRLQRHSHLPLLRRVWELRDNLTAYDGCYVALTEALGATLITRDAAFSRIRIRSGKVLVV